MRALARPVKILPSLPEVPKARGRWIELLSKSYRVRASGLRAQKDRVQCMGNAWVMGHDCNIPAPSQLGRARLAPERPRGASRLVFGTALCDMICGRPAASGVPFLVRLSYLLLRCAQSYIRSQPAGGSASAQFTRVHHIDGKPLCSQWRRRVASERLSGSREQAIECEDRAQLLTAAHEAKARKCQDIGPQTRSRLMGSRFR